MKRLFIITFLLLVCTNIFVQQGYRFGMKFVRLIPQDKIFFVQTKEIEADNTFRSRVVKQLGGKNITYPLAELIQGILNSADGFVINEIHILKNG